MRASFLISILVALLTAASVNAQTGRPGLQPLPEPPAPARDLEPGVEPQVTIRKETGDTIEEFRVGGRLVMIRVTPAHGVPYILTDSKGDGSFTNRRDSLELPPGVPMWVLFTF